MIVRSPRISACLFACLMFGLLPISHGASILVLGDSISAAYGLKNPEQGWVGLLQAEIKNAGRSEQVVNASISGETTAGGLARIDGLLEKHKPSLLILELGANDGLRGLSPDHMQSNLREILSRAEKHGSKVLLLGMRIPPNYGKRYNDLLEAVYPNLAKQMNITLVPFLLEGVGGQKELMQADGLHPNEQAQPILFKQIWERVSVMLSAKSATPSESTRAMQLPGSVIP